jgi:hypothetical protein
MTSNSHNLLLDDGISFNLLLDDGISFTVHFLLMFLSMLIMNAVHLKMLLLISIINVPKTCGI